MREAIGLVFYDIGEHFTGIKTDVSKFREENNGRLEKALLEAFDPFSREEIMDTLKKHFNEDTLTHEELKLYYRTPVSCLLRIKSSRGHLTPMATSSSLRRKWVI